MSDEPFQHQLQELYRHLDGADSAADRRLAYYAQLRAKEVPHTEALETTVKYFKLELEPWYQERLKKVKT